MTSRERTIGGARGGAIDRKPVVIWPAQGAFGDVVVHPSTGFDHATNLDPDRVHVVEVLNPFGRALAKRMDLNGLLKADPSSGNEVLSALEAETNQEIAGALASGADGVLYVLHGARAQHCTPMQYGGYYLERDRALLHSIEGSVLNLVFVVGGEDVYLDFVSDLPAHVFGWDYDSTGIAPAEVRGMRQGALLAANPEADFILHSHAAKTSSLLEGRLLSEATHE